MVVEEFDNVEDKIGHEWGGWNKVKKNIFKDNILKWPKSDKPSI